LRFERSDTPRYGSCLTCLTSSGPFVELLAEHVLGELHGTSSLILCEHCIALLGREIGMATASDSERLAAQADELDRDYEATSAAIKQRKDKLAQRVSLAEAR